MKFSKILTESTLSGKNLICVDIQPEYRRHFGFSEYEFGNFLNEQFSIVKDLYLIYNGPELGFPGEEDYRMWLSQECEVNEETLYGIHFVDKGYAFFRYCMDSNIDHEITADFIRFMYENGINDSRDMNRPMWTKFLRSEKRKDRKTIYELFKHTSDCVYIPDLMDKLKSISGPICLCGGGLNECLKEVEIAFMALNKPYEIYEKFVY